VTEFLCVHPEHTGTCLHTHVLFSEHPPLISQPWRSRNDRPTAVTLLRHKRVPPSYF